MHKQTKSNSIRIIAGQWRGRRLPVKDSPGLRPTTDRVRETVFNWLAPYIHSARCLDLFAGTGALGLEGLSRGAKFVQFVESNRAVGTDLKACLETLVSDDIKADAQLVIADAMQVIKTVAATPFDVVFLDPPFKTTLLEQAATLLEQNRWMSDDALIYIEHDVHQVPPKLPSNWQQIKQAKAGQCSYCLLKREVC